MRGPPAFDGRTLLVAAVFTMAACSADTAGVDFARLVRPSTPNTYLVCPRDRCRATADEEGPVYAIPAAQLFERARTAISGEPRTELVQNQPEPMRLVFVQRSLVFRFPDTITVQVFPLADGGSTLAMYSQSNYGRSDFGVNKARVRRWLAFIKAAAAAGSSP